MAKSSISGIVYEAAETELVAPLRIYGNQTYTLSTNLITWGDGMVDSLKNIANTFGLRSRSSLSGVVHGSENGFKCGNGIISAYDFGLLYTVFTAMVMCRVESGGSPHVFCDDTKRRDTLNVLWIGCECIIYSADRNIILPTKSADVERICSGQKVLCKNFCTRDAYEIDRENNMIGVTNSNTGELLTRITIPEIVISTYNKYFVSQSIVDLPETDWDEGSPLGQLISSNDQLQECTAIVQQYKNSANVASVVVRDDLVVTPNKRYGSTENFFGSLCYTDKQEIVVAVSEHRGLFTYYPWFVSETDSNKDLKVDTPNFQDFYDVSEGVIHILRYAKSVATRPPTRGQVNDVMLSKIKDSFFNLKLPRIQMKAAFGKIIVPEEVLLQAISTDSTANLYCLLPVGTVGINVITMSPEGDTQVMVMPNWDVTYFYDITEVI